MLRVMFLALIAFSPVVSAQSINKCPHPRTGAVAYSSAPCPTTEAGWKAEFEGTGDASDRDRMSSAEAQARVAANQRYLDRSRRAERSGYSRSRGASVPTTIGRCDAAKRQRDAELAGLGKAGRSIEVRRAYDARVAAACK